MSQSLTTHLIVPVVSADDAYATTRSLREYPHSEVTVVHTAKHVNLFRQTSVNTIENPRQLIAGYLYRAVARPAIVDYVEVGDEAEVFEITVTEDAPLAGKTLTEAGKANLLPDDVLIVAVERESQDESLNSPEKYSDQGEQSVNCSLGDGSGARTHGYLRTSRRSNSVAED